MVWDKQFSIPCFIFDIDVSAGYQESLSVSINIAIALDSVHHVLITNRLWRQAIGESGG